MKKYDNGILTPRLIDKIPFTLQISAPRGEGLRMSQTKKGHIIIVTGGTGLYPFCDLIDLLFKTYLLFNRSDLKRHILAADPILATNPFA